jgi:hypothetical protein
MAHEGAWGIEKTTAPDADNDNWRVSVDFNVSCVTGLEKCRAPSATTADKLYVLNAMGPDMSPSGEHCVTNADATAVGALVAIRIHVWMAAGALRVRSVTGVEPRPAQGAMVAAGSQISRCLGGRPGGSPMR